MAYALERRQHFADHGAAAFERFANAALVVVERLEPRFRRCNFRFDAANTTGGVDQVLIELAAVGAELFDFPLERGLGFGRLALGIACGLEVLVWLFQRVKFFGFVGLRKLYWPVLCECRSGR